MNLLPSNESGWLTQNRTAYLYGTEAPDNSGASFQGRKGYGDQSTKHHNYYSGTTCTDDSASDRASEEYAKALACLKNGSYAIAAWYAGAMAHYISDVSAWPHVLSNESGTAHSDYEDQVNAVTKSYGMNTFTISFDGSLETMSAYDGAKSVGLDTYLDGGQPYNAVWMNDHFLGSWSSVNDWSSNPHFKPKVSESISLAVNTVADVLHTLIVESGASIPPSGGQGIQISPETIAVIVFVVAIVVGALFVKRKR
jgi:hypothetical protein